MDALEIANALTLQKISELLDRLIQTDEDIDCTINELLNVLAQYKPIDA